MTAPGECTLTNVFCVSADFSEETEEAEAYGSGVNVNKVQHSYYTMTLLLFCIFSYFKA